MGYTKGKHCLTTYAQVQLRHFKTNYSIVYHNGHSYIQFMRLAKQSQGTCQITWVPDWSLTAVVTLNYSCIHL